MAIPMTMIQPTPADAFRYFGVPQSYIRYHNCKASGKPHWYCEMSDSEQHAHDEKVRRESEDGSTGGSCCMNSSPQKDCSLL